MAEKVKAKKSKTLSKKPVARSKKAETGQEVAAVEAASKKASRTKVSSRSKDSKPVELAAAEAVVSVIEASLPPLEQKFTAAPDEPREATSFIMPKAIAKPETEAEFLNVKLSRALLRKLRDQAADEGISLEEFVTELLAESVVLRAWEIVERKNQMKGGNGGLAPMGNNRSSNNPSGPNNNNRHRGNKGHRGMSPMRYQTIMEDKASFLEYVRNQERNRR